MKSKLAQILHLARYTGACGAEERGDAENTSCALFIFPLGVFAFFVDFFHSLSCKSKYMHA